MFRPNHSPPGTPDFRYSISGFSSPANVRASEEDTVIFEFGSLHITAGVSRESVPRCFLTCGPYWKRRVGLAHEVEGLTPDIAPSNASFWQSWAADHELWNYDCRDGNYAVATASATRLIKTVYERSTFAPSNSRRPSVALGD